MNRELASIVFTVYNQEQYVRESLSSALNQTYEPLEIVVSDDGSTDNTKQIILVTLKESGFEPVSIDNTVVEASGGGIPQGWKNSHCQFQCKESWHLPKF